MRTFLRGFGFVALMLGIMAIAGSAGDCDGKCMEYANTIPEMLLAIGVGLILVIGGGACIVSADRF